MSANQPVGVYSYLITYNEGVKLLELHLELLFILPNMFWVPGSS